MNITFKEGLPAFEEYKNFVIELNEDKENPFHILQSLDEPELSFTIMNPFIIKADYNFILADSTVEKLEISSYEDVLVYTMVTIPDEDYKNMTTNLLGPIIINKEKKLAKQIILNDTNYTTKHRIMGSGE